MKTAVDSIQEPQPSVPLFAPFQLELLCIAGVIVLVLLETLSVDPLWLAAAALVARPSIVCLVV